MKLSFVHFIVSILSWTATLRETEANEEGFAAMGSPPSKGGSQPGSSPASASAPSTPGPPVGRRDSREYHPKLLLFNSELDHILSNFLTFVF